MTDKEKSTTETDSTDASNTNNTTGGAVHTAISAALARLRRVLAYSTTAADQRPPIVADGGQSDAKVIGHNTDSSGQTVGVWGEVDSTDGCGLATPDDARIDGDLLTNATGFTVQAGTTTTEDAQNIVAGHASNRVTDSAVGATIAGGGYDDGSDDDANVVHDNYGTVGGGRENQAGSDDNDAATAPYATVGGGGDNTASGQGATVPGGEFGAAEDSRSFVWNDGTEYHAIPNTEFDGLSSNKKVNGEPVTGSNTFSVSATGGVRFITGSSSVTYIESGSTGWTTSSSRAVKTNVDPVDPQEALDGVDSLEISRWEYEGEDGDGTGKTHVGPMAEQFHDAFEVGTDEDDTTINAIDRGGVALAAIQGLSSQLAEKDERIEGQQAQIDDQQEHIDALEAENAELRKRLTAVETRLGMDDAAASGDD